MTRFKPPTSVWALPGLRRKCGFHRVASPSPGFSEAQAGLPEKLWKVDSVGHLSVFWVRQFRVPVRMRAE